MAFDVYGRDLLISNGDIGFTRNGKLETVDQISNLKQAIHNRLLTNKKQLYRNLNFGGNLPLAVGKPMSLQLKQRMIHEVSTTLKEEPRIEKINFVRLIQSQENDRAFFVEVNIKPIAIKTSVNFVFPTVSEVF